MKLNKNIFILFILQIIIAANQDRIVTIGGCVTEIVFRLGAGNKVVAVDQSSTVPSEVTELPQVGYIRAISSEGILSMSPTMILTTTDIGPSKVVEQLKNSGVELHVFNSPHSFDDILSLISDVSILIDMEKKAVKLIDSLLVVENSIKEIKSEKKYQNKIVFFMNPSKASYTAAGSKTRADYLIDFIGGVNIFSENFGRYNKVTNEEILNQNPDVILFSSVMPKGQEISSSVFFDNPQFDSINAVKNNKVIQIDMNYLTFGPSFITDALYLINQIYKN